MLQIPDGMSSRLPSWSRSRHVVMLEFYISLYGRMVSWNISSLFVFSPLMKCVYVAILSPQMTR